MTSSNTSISPLRQRLIDVMAQHKLAPKMGSGYIRAAKMLAGFLNRTSDTATATALKFFFEVTGYRKVEARK